MQINAEIDIYDQKLGSLIDPQMVKLLSKLSIWRGILQIALEWVGIAVAIALCKAYWNPLFYIITIAWIGARQNGLAALLHDATHYRLLPNRQWNEWVAEIFTAWPLLITLNGYRQTHFPHHRHTNAPGDPDWQRQQRNTAKYYPKSMREMVVITLKYWLGYYAIPELMEFQQEAKLPAKVQIGRLCFYAVVVAASIALHFWTDILIYWVVPLFTFFLWLIFVRTITEHSRENFDDLLKKSRHVNANLFERLTVAPNRVYVHTAHHLYPSIPFYNLEKAHALLMKNPEFARRAHISKSYIALVKESIEANKHYIT